MTQLCRSIVIIIIALITIINVISISISQCLSTVCSSLQQRLLCHTYISVHLRKSRAQVEHRWHWADGETTDLFWGKSLKRQRHKLLGEKILTNLHFMSSLLKMNRTHLDTAKARGREQGTTSEPRGDNFLWGSQPWEVDEVCCEAQGADHTHHVQNPPSWRRDGTWVYLLILGKISQQIPTVLQTGLTVPKVVKATNTTATWDMWWHHHREHEITLFLSLDSCWTIVHHDYVTCVR